LCLEKKKGGNLISAINLPQKEWGEAERDGGKGGKKKVPEFGGVTFPAMDTGGGGRGKKKNLEIPKKQKN